MSRLYCEGSNQGELEVVVSLSFCSIGKEAGFAPSNLIQVKLSTRRAL